MIKTKISHRFFKYWHKYGNEHKYEQNTKSKNPEFVKTKKGRIMISSNCAVSGSLKYKFIKQ